MKKKLIFLLLIIAMAISPACRRSDSQPAPQPINVYLTDKPAAYDQVLIDLKEVQIRYVSDSIWNKLSTRSGMYDLLTLRNGNEALIASGTLKGQELQELRLVLGRNNIVVVGAQAYPLFVPSGQSSGLKVKVDSSFTHYKHLVIDFDAEKSIHVDSTGTYLLRPVLRVKK